MSYKDITYREIHKKFAKSNKKLSTNFIITSFTQALIKLLQMFISFFLFLILFQNIFFCSNTLIALSCQNIKN